MATKSGTRRMTGGERDGTVIDQSGQILSEPRQERPADPNQLVTIQAGGPKYWYQPSEGDVIDVILRQRIRVPRNGLDTFEYLVEAVSPAKVRGSKKEDIATLKPGDQYYITERFALSQLKYWGPGMFARLTFLGKRNAKEGRTVWDVRIEGKAVEQKWLAAHFKTAPKLLTATINRQGEEEIEDDSEYDDEVPY